MLGELNRQLDELRARVREPRRHRPPDARRLDLDRHPRHRRALPSISAQVEALELVLADGSSLEISRRRSRRRSRAARIGLGALGMIYAVTLRTVPAFTLDRVDSPRPLAETLDAPRRAQRRQRPLRVLRLPAHRDRALPREPAHRRAAASAARRARVYAQEVVLENWVGRLFALAGRRLPSQAPRLARIAAAGIGRSTQDRPQPPRLRQRAADQVHRDGVRDPARARRRGGRAGARVRRAARARGRVSDRGPLRRPPTTSTLSTAHERDTCYIAVHQDRTARLGALLPRRRADHGLLRRPPALGQAPLPDRRDAGARATRAGTSSSALRRAARPRPVSPTPTPTASSARRSRGTPCPRRGRSAPRRRSARPRSGRASRSARTARRPSRGAGRRGRRPAACRRRRRCSGVCTSPAPSWRSKRRPPGR